MVTKSFEETAAAFHETLNILNSDFCALRCTYWKSEGPLSYKVRYPEDSRGNCTKCKRRVWTRERWEESKRR